MTKHEYDDEDGDGDGDHVWWLRLLWGLWSMVIMMMINVNVTAGDNDTDDDMVNCILVRQFKQLLTMSLMLTVW